MPLLIMRSFFQSVRHLFGTNPYSQRSQTQTSYSHADSPIAGRWNLQTYLGSGNMAEVWLAEDIKQGGMVALKILPKHLQQDEELQKRFEEEIRNLRYLTDPDSPESLSTYLGDGLSEAEKGFQEPIFCLAMAYISGESLDPDGVFLRSFDLEERLAILRSISQAITYMHARGVQHRDIKPENIRVDANRNAVLTDLGIAKSEQSDLRLTTIGRIGSIAYMSPQGADDIYAFAVTAHEILCDGKHPFGNINRMTEVELRQRQQSFLPERPTWVDLPSQRLRTNWQPAINSQKMLFNRLFAKALSNNLEDRPKTIADFMAMLDQTIDPTEVTPDPIFSIRQGLILFGLIMTIMVILFGLIVFSGNSEDDESGQQAITHSTSDSEDNINRIDASPTNPANVLRTIIGTEEGLARIILTQTAENREPIQTSTLTRTTTLTLTVSSFTPSLTNTRNPSPTSTTTPRPSLTRTMLPTPPSMTPTPDVEPATSLSELMDEFLEAGDYFGQINCEAFSLAYNRLIDRLEVDDPEFEPAQILIEGDSPLLPEIASQCMTQGDIGTVTLELDDRVFTIQDELEVLRDR